MNPDYILAAGVRNPHQGESYFASTFVDIAYAQALPQGKVKIEVEPDTDLRSASDRNWILELIWDAFQILHEDDVTTEIILSESSNNEEAEQGVAPNRSLPPSLNSTSSVRGSED